MQPPEPPSPANEPRVRALLFEVARRLNAGATWTDVLRQVAEQARALVGADGCDVMLLDVQRQQLRGGAAPDTDVAFRVGEGVAGWVVEHGAAALVADTEEDPRFKAVPGQDIRSLVCVPLITRDGAVGTLTASASRVDAFTAEHQELLVYLCAAAIRDVENARLYRLSTTDVLTHARNRQYLFQRLPEEVERARRYGAPLSVVLLDVDHFKDLNAQHGHLAGDFALKEFARLALCQVREVDALVRYGGEEFLVLLPHTDGAGAVRAAERLRAAVEKLPLRWNDQQLPLTVSAGVATWRPGDTDGALLGRADKALARAWAAGRNRVVAA
ncbi:MAG: sensor domain-containing diguanylate cyclase [Deltaproteobacteria bacterium]|nr:sensor domain-containing diguanylate cyclase [Deltaproteobacteria bacterium]